MWGLKTKPLTSEQEQLLRSQEITADAPGAVLHDFDVLLHFVGINGIKTSGELRLLPLAALAELNSAMREPLRLDLNRAQLRSYPNLSALHILGRASGLLMPQGGGKDMRLAIDPELLAQWVDFNPVERYCMLLEVWLLHGQPEMVGHRGGPDSFLLRAIDVWSRIPKGGKKYSAAQRGSADGYKDIDYDRNNLGFLWLFGLVTVEQGTPLPKKTWCPAAVRRIPFGDALLSVLANTGMPRVNEDGVFEVPFTSDGAEAEDEDAVSDGTTEKPVSLDQLQPALSPYFPGWRKTLTIPPPEFRDGVYVFKVSLAPGKVWRRLAMPGRYRLGPVGRRHHLQRQIRSRSPVGVHLDGPVRSQTRDHLWRAIDVL
jgi:hypothetical protein